MTRQLGAWSNYAHMRTKYEQRSQDPRWAHLQFVRLRSTGEVRDWLATLPDARS